MSYESGELGDGEAEPVERHLQACPACREAFDRIRAENPEARRLRTVFQEAKGGTTLMDDGDVGTTDVDGVRPLTPPEPGEPEVPAQPPDRQAAPAAKPAAGDAEGARGRHASGHFGALGSTEWPIPDYERVLLCGEGSYGSVWAVRDRVGVYRALKIIDMERMRQSGVSCRERSALEVYCRKVARHPYLITVYHVGVVGPYLYYTMELADDRMMQGSGRDTFPANYRPLTLDTIIRGRRLKVDVAIELARRLLRGLAKLHSLDLVHRDIKPSNIVFVNRHPKLADIGVLTPTADSGRVVGTPRYMPPDRIIDQTADIYAFGKVLHEMIAGRDAATFPALPDDCQWGSMRWDLQRVSDVIVRACSDEAADRYQSASAMLEDLEASTKLLFDSLFEELNAPPKDTPPTAAEVALDLGYAFIRVIPWILAFLAVVYAIARFT